MPAPASEYWDNRAASVSDRSSKSPAQRFHNFALYTFNFSLSYIPSLDGRTRRKHQCAKIIALNLENDNISCRIAKKTPSPSLPFRVSLL
jgi:hypothetical protein